MEKKTDRKVALITGASKGIGAATAKILAAAGYDIWLNYNTNHDAAKKIRAEIQALGRACTLLCFDVSNEDEVRKILLPLLDAVSPDVLVNNAGFAKDAMFGLMGKSDWNSVLNVHLDGFFNVTRLIAPLMQRRRFGRIINIVSTSGQTGNPGQVNYSAAKAGIIGATKALAKELGRRNVLVNAVAPGFIDTDMVSGLPADKIISHIPLGRIGLPEDVACCVSFLCSEKASYITGQVISVNGGLYV